MRKVGFWISVVFLLFLGLSGVQSFFGDWGDVETVGQRATNIGQAVFGAFGLLAGIGAIQKREWASLAALGFAVSAGVTAGLASVAWGETGLATGIASGAVGLLIGLVLWLGVGARTPSTETSLSE